ncbi:MAG: hypothetical protein PHG84_04270 [Endomicrobiaceae bacterium]|nr:hypothetical protein [Endomicrobiaceae bacterium]MDD3053598.1 hypothetical protein [Endomicrobiaceae bacterium]MDD3922759.1 hypothetical protein [Endomicrobiaceae bacterium]
MKKTVSLLLFFGFVFLLSSSLFAASTLITKTAEVSFTGGEVSFSADLFYTTATATSASKISWDASTITLDSPNVDWQIANVYAVLHSTITTVVGNAKVYMYQDNKNAVGNYVATSSRTEGTESLPIAKYNGLVKSGSGGGENGYLAMSYRISTTTLDVSTYIIDPETTVEEIQYKNRYITDKSDGNYEVGAYSLVSDYNGFVVNVSSAVPPTPNYILPKNTNNTAYMYFGAGFKNIYAGTSYGTDKLIFELVTE